MYGRNQHNMANQSPSNKKKILRNWKLTQRVNGGNLCRERVQEYDLIFETIWIFLPQQEILVIIEKGEKWNIERKSAGLQSEFLYMVTPCNKPKYHLKMCWNSV